MSNNHLIVQVFEVPFLKLAEQIPYYSKLGFTHIQISPVQEHCTHVEPWYRFYQPTGSTLPGNSMGSREDLQHLINVIHENNMKIIIDVVLHHTCPCVLCNKYAKLDSFMWSGKDFARWMYGSVSVYARFGMLDWGPKQLVEREETMHQHLELLRNLLEMEVDGFRFDAAKHMQPAYFDELLDRFESERELFIYCEVLDGSVELCQEYVQKKMRVVNFPLTFRMIEAFSLGNDIRSILSNSLPYEKSVCLADCHDSILGDSYKFGDFHDGLLGACFLLSRGNCPTLLYSSLTTYPHIVAGIQYFNQMSKEPFQVEENLCTETLLVTTRGKKGISILNKAGDWYRNEVFDLGENKVEDGLWKELVYKFDVIFENGKCTKWGGHSVGVVVAKEGDDKVDVVIVDIEDDDAKTKWKIDIGPREVLFLTHCEATV
jgi:alpha-amylase